MWWHDGWSGWWFVMPLMMVVFWVAVVCVVVSFMQGRPGPDPTSGTRPAGPEEVLAQRYARGEIDDDEYSHRLDILHGTRHPRDQR